MAEFEQVVSGLFREDELESMSYKLNAFSEFAVREVPCDDNVTDARIEIFSAAHDLNYADCLYKVLKQSGFPTKYISYLSGVGASRSIGKT